jgi:hypothetical protein
VEAAKATEVVKERQGQRKLARGGRALSLFIVKFIVLYYYFIIGEKLFQE